MEALNKKQQAAVDITDGPALVVAGAGTGKTRVIVERIIRLINDGVQPENILALTFTEKAAGEMADRVGEASLTAALDSTIATFNGFGNDLLKQYGSEWGLGELRLLGETGQRVFLREHFDSLELDYFAPVSNPDGQLKDLAAYVSALKQQLVKPEDYSKYADKLPAGDEAEKLDKIKHQELARFYVNYTALCRANSVIDYDDQIFLSVQLLQARPNILRTLQQRYRYMLVDEFQDTNPMQSALVDLLASGHQNLMVVGDDDQSIYGWRGATLANILDFSKRYPAAQHVTLIENYRSTQEILDVAYRLIQNNNPERLEVINKLDKRLHAQASGMAPVLQHHYSFEAELTSIAENIAWRISNGQDPAQIAVLARGRQSAERMHEALELHGVEHAVSGQKSNLYQQPVVQQLIELLKAVNDPLDNMALFHALSGPAFDLPTQELAALAAQARVEHDSLQDMIRAAGSKNFTAAAAVIADWREQSKGLSVGNLAYKVISDSGWKQRLYDDAKENAEAYVQVQALSEYFKTLKEFERIASVPSLQGYLIGLPALEAGGSDFEDASLQISDSMVNVMTVHASKGLEWDTVFVIDCLEQSFPLTSGSRSSLQVPSQLRAVQSTADEHMAEERRLMYVAATRARKELIITYSDKHGTGARRKPSRFIAEMFESPADTLVERADQTNLELFAPKEYVVAASLPDSMLQKDTLVLTASQIECWLKCPQDFYYKHVLHMPEPDSPAAAYGTVMHDVIRAIFDGRRNGEVPTLEALTEKVMQALPRAGYATPGVRERAHAQALASLQAIYKRFLEEELPTADERPFAVEVPDLPIKIVGRIDAIYERPSGVEIRDFKTSSSVTTPEKAKSRATGSQQLTVYALAWQIMHDSLPEKLTLDFVETGQIGPVRRTQRSIDTLLSHLTTMNEQLRAGVYPMGKKHDYCSHP